MDYAKNTNKILLQETVTENSIGNGSDFFLGRRTYLH